MSRSPSCRALAGCLVLAQLLLGCPPANPPLAPAAGFAERREPNLVAVPGGLVDVAGGKLVVQRSDLVLDTRLGRESFGAVYDSAAGGWRFSFESRYDGALFTDESGASFAVAGLAAGAAIPGTWWVKRDATRMQTKGGLVHEYGAGGLLVARYWASDPYPRLRHTIASVAGALRTTAIEQCTSASTCTPVFAFAYDAAGRLASVVDRAGRRAEYGWDAQGRLASARDGLDVAEGWPGFRYAYVGTKLASLTNSEGEAILYAWSGAALTSATQVGPGSPQHRFQLEGKDAAGLYHTRHWSPLGDETRWAYDALGRVVEKVLVATGETTRWTWSGERVSAEVLPSGATTSWLWAGDAVQQRTDPSGNQLSFTYAPNGVDREAPHARALASLTDSLGAVETRSYDAAGRLVAVTKGAGDVVTTTWSQGVRTSETRAGVTRHFAEVGEHGHPARVTVFGTTHVRSFDAVGNLLQGPGEATPLAGGIERRAFDADRNLVALTLQPASPGAAPLTLELAYRSDGQRLAVLRGGDDHVFVYDAFGRVAEQRERVDGAWQTTRFGFDAAGRALFVERPNGMREELAYGPGDRVATLRRLRGGFVEESLALAWSSGLLASIVDSGRGTERYVYDAAGRRIETHFAGGERLEVAYDLRSRVREERFVSAAGATAGVLTYGYDLSDRRVAIADAGGELWAASHAGGRLAELRTGNGLVRSFAYRGDGLPSGSLARDAGGQVVEETTLTSELVVDDADGSFSYLQRAITATHGGVEVTTLEEYRLGPVADGSPGSLAGARLLGWSDGLGAEEEHRYDARSNLLAQGGALFAYNAEGNRLLGVLRGGETVGSYAYDAAGFATARNGVPLAWDAAGRLVAHGADTLVWDGQGRLAEVRVAGATLRFAFGGRVSVDASGRPLAVDLGEVLVGFGGVHRYRHLDFRGNVKFVSDDAGEVVAHYRYAGFGLDAVFGADDDPVRFAARPELGELMLLGARIYDPAVGRFLSPDPLFQIVNAYAYTLGNPVWFSDPDGLSAEANGSAIGVDNLVGSLGALAAGLSLVAALLKFAPVPHLHVLAAILGLVSALLGLLIALMLLFGKPRQPASSLASMTLEAPVGSAGAINGTGGGGGGPGCSPAALTALPGASRWLAWLLPLQLLLGLHLLRRRRRAARSET